MISQIKYESKVSINTKTRTRRCHTIETMTRTRGRSTDVQLRAGCRLASIHGHSIRRYQIGGTIIGVTKKGCNRNTRLLCQRYRWGEQQPHAKEEKQHCSDLRQIRSENNSGEWNGQ